MSRDGNRVNDEAAVEILSTDNLYAIVGSPRWGI